MHLNKNEEVVKVFHHHTTTVFVRIFKIILAGLPCFAMAYFISFFLVPLHTIYMYVGVGLLFAIVAVYDFTLYYLDRLIITNHRVIHVDWQGPFKRYEHEAEIADIQDIATRETGILSFIKIFDYGDFTLETAATHTTIRFYNAPNPEGIKHFIYHLNIKPNQSVWLIAL